SSEQIGVSSGTGPRHPAWKLVKSTPMGAPYQDRDAGSNPAGATNLTGSTGKKGAGRQAPWSHPNGPRSAVARARPCRLSTRGAPRFSAGSAAQQLAQ